MAVMCDCHLYYSAGDLCDKLSILIIKSIKIPSYPSDEFEKTCVLTGRMLVSQPEEVWIEYFVLLENLVRVNLDQWSFEDRVRSEKSHAAAVAARINNTKRVAIKNQVNRLLKYPEEIKRYQ